MKWIDPETRLPEEGQKVLIKRVIMHNRHINAARYKDNVFTELEIPYKDHEDIWGWQPFEDSNERE